MLKNKHKKFIFNKNYKPKRSLINSKNGNYLAINLCFGDVKKEENDFNTNL